MKSTTRHLLILFTVIIFSTACHNYKTEKGNGDIITENYDITGFNELDIDGFFEVFLTQGASEKIVISTDENLFEFIEVTSEGSTLILETEDGINLQSKHGVKVYITYNKLSQIAMSGAGVIKTENTLNAQALKIKMSGAGIIDLELEIEELDLKLSGAGSIILSGNADEQALSLSGAGSVDAYKLQSETCTARLAGVGSAKLYVTKSIDATVSGIGSIKYKGNPRHVIKNVSGIGKISNTDHGDEEEESI